MAPVSESNGESESIGSSVSCHIPWVVRPSPGINYNFVTTMYLAGTVLAAIFYALEKHIFPSILLSGSVQNTMDKNGEMNNVSGVNSASKSDDGDAWKEFFNGMEGMYLIFAPFIPCLLWSYVVRSYWLKETSNSLKEKTDN